MKAQSLLLVLAISMLGSCHIHSYSRNRSYRSQSQVLAEKVSDDGHTLQWKIFATNSSSGARVDFTQTFTETTPRVGLTVAPVTRERAQSVGVVPFEGVWITLIEENSVAAAVGLSVGDIILEVGGVTVSSKEQYEDTFDQKAVVGEPLSYTINVYRRPGEPIEGLNTTTVDMIPVGLDIRQKSTDSIPLDGSRGIIEYTGLRVATLPAELCESMFGENECRVVVASVRNGSPAHSAGFRVGDRLISCDGEKIVSLDQVRASIYRCYLAKDMHGPLFDLAAVQPASLRSSEAEESEVGRGLSSDRVLLEVEGPLGHHAAQLALHPDLDDDTHVYVPIVLDYDSDIDSARVSFLDFIFQFGFNYRSDVVSSATREPFDRWEFSMLPFGMFEIRKRLSGTRYTLFWFIEFEV